MDFEIFWKIESVIFHVIDIFIDFGEIESGLLEIGF